MHDDVLHATCKIETFANQKNAGVLSRGGWGAMAPLDFGEIS